MPTLLPQYESEDERSDEMIFFRYFTGEQVQLGDVVRFGGDGEKEFVVMIIQPNTEEAEAYFCEDTGGFMVGRDETGMSMYKEGDDIWEDLEFIARGHSTKNDPCSKD